MSPDAPEPVPPRKKRRRPPDRPRFPNLEEPQILGWADLHYARTGKWPTANSGQVVDAPREKWANLDACLRVGLRGLQGGSSLARLLAKYRDVRNLKDLPRLTEEGILAWADAHRDRTGAWPAKESGMIPEAPGETWVAIDQALFVGHRGLPGGSSLARLLAQHRGRRNRKGLPPYSEDQILAWADAHRERTGRWPAEDSGAISDAPGETWMAVTRALADGIRGLPGGSSLARLLAERRGARNRAHAPPLHVEQILAWADAHRERTGRWPVHLDGALPEAPEETWGAVNIALQLGGRGLDGGSSLARLLAEHRHRPNPAALPPLSEAEILRWAERYRERTGRWPRSAPEPIEEAPEVTWRGVDKALRLGRRGLPGGTTLARLLAAERGARVQRSATLTEEQILAWARAEFTRSGTWPSRSSGPVADVPGLTWCAVDLALKRGTRGLPGGSSLSQLLQPHRRKGD